MQVAAVQHDIVFEDGAATCARLQPAVAAAVAGGAHLIVLSEMFATGFSMQPERIAEPPGGPIETWLIDQAAQHQVWIVGSIAQQVDDGAVNVAVLAAPDGRTFRYDKIHPFSFAGEHEHYRAGEKALTVDVDGLRVSIFICYDLRFADHFWALAHDTDCYVVVANWPEPRREHWRALLRARAIENQAYVVAVNRVGAVGKINHVGDSAIIDPLGRTLVEGSQVETVLSAEVNAAEVASVRERFQFLADR